MKEKKEKKAKKAYKTPKFTQITLMSISEAFLQTATGVQAGGSTSKVNKVEGGGDDDWVASKQHSGFSIWEEE